MSSGLEIVGVPAFSDNYLWLVHDHDSGETAVVDPGDPAPILAEAERRDWMISKILNTHWHPDHTGGNLAIKEASGATIIGPAGENGRVPGLDVALKEGDRVSIGAHEAEIWEVPGHTLGHIAYIFSDDGVAFVGDTMFAMGCGRLFEGTADQMHHSLGRLAGLPDATKLFCAHDDQRQVDRLERRDLVSRRVEILKEFHGIEIEGRCKGRDAKRARMCEQLRKPLVRRRCFFVEIVQALARPQRFALDQEIPFLAADSQRVRGIGLELDGVGARLGRHFDDAARTRTIATVVGGQFRDDIRRLARTDFTAVDFEALHRYHALTGRTEKMGCTGGQPRLAGKVPAFSSSAMRANALS